MCLNDVCCVAPSDNRYFLLSRLRMPLTLRYMTTSIGFKKAEASDCCGRDRPQNSTMDSVPSSDEESGSRIPADWDLGMISPGVRKLKRPKFSLSPAGIMKDSASLYVDNIWAGIERTHTELAPQCKVVMPRKLSIYLTDTEQKS